MLTYEYDYRDKNKTLIQNYRRLGLSSRLKAPAGGVEKSKSRPLDASTKTLEESDPLLNLGSSKTTTLKPAEARVERDPETGKILRIIRPENEGENDDEIEIAGRKRRKSNPLNDPLAESSTEYEAAPGQQMNASAPNDVVQALEEQAALEEASLSKKRPRQQSKREEEWIQRLLEKHGDNVSAMVKDKKLNAMQQTEGDIRRRIRKWRESHN